MQVDRFENDNEICDFSGDVSDVEQLCYSSDELHKVNPRSPVGGSSTTANAVDELLCVSKVNREYKVTNAMCILFIKLTVASWQGDFYDTPVWRDSSVFQTSEGQKGFEYGDEIMTVCWICCVLSSITLTVMWIMTLHVRSNLMKFMIEMIRFIYIVISVGICCRMVF